VQVLDPSVKEFKTYSNDDGHFIEAFGISTKRNGNNWAIAKATGHEKVKQFQDRDFAIIPQMLKGPTKGHYFGNDTEEDLLNGYSKHSHGKIINIKGPFNYNDGTDDYFYNFVIKLRDSKAAAILNEYGPKMWIPFSISPHIMPLSGPDWEMDDWHAIGTALVDRGAYGDQAIISKFCTGSSAVCEKSLAASFCDKADLESAQIITSLVSKAASFQPSMSETITNAVSNAPPVAELKAEPTITPVQAPKGIEYSPEQIEQIRKEAQAKSEAIWKEKVTALETKDKINTLNLVWAKVKDPTVKEALIKKYQTLENVDIVKEIADDVLKNLSQEEEKEEEKDKPTGDKPLEQKKSKAASLELTKEPDIPEQKESKAASLQDNPAQTIHNFIMGGRK
jgi:hypothetical protein